MDRDELSPLNPRVVALVGNPNSGKTSLFNALSGLNHHVGNFAGVTVERKAATVTFGSSKLLLVDLPGINSLYPQSEDERVTSDILHQPEHPDHPDEVWVVVDGTQLRRGLMLCSQVLDLGFGARLIINMMDLVEQEGATIDIKLLEQLLGVEVFPISVARKQGLDALTRRAPDPVQSTVDTILNIPPGFQTVLEELKPMIPTTNDYFAYQVLLDPGLLPGLPAGEMLTLRAEAQITQQTADQLISNELLVRMDRADNWISRIWKGPPSISERWTERVDRWLIHPVLGYLIFAFILLLIFQSIFVWATYPMDWIEAGIGWLGEAVRDWLPVGWGTDLLVDGVIAGVAGIVVFIPQIAFLFLFISILEDSGYMARVVHLMDRIMQPFGFSGRSVIPLMGGMACAIPSIMMSRGISNPKERIITIMVTPLISCSARIPVYTLLIAMFIPAEKVWGIDQRGLVMGGLYLLGFVMALLVAFVFKVWLKHEPSSIPFVMEMPAYRWPRWRNTLRTVWQKSYAFVAEAGKIILAISIILWALVSYGPAEEMQQLADSYQAEMATLAEQDGKKADSLAMAYASERLNHSYAAKLGQGMEPIIKPLGYDWKIGISLVTSFAAREVFVSTMSIIYQQQDPGEMEEEEGGRLALVNRLQAEKDPETGQPIYTLATVLSLLIFYVFAMQCVSTLAVTQKEAGWRWALVMLLYLTALAYFSAWGTYSLFA